MDDMKLAVTKRDVFGRKLKGIRKDGIIPANVFGKKVKSLAVSVKKDDLVRVFDQAGETTIVTLSVEGEKETRPVLLQNVHRHPVSDEILHADLRQVVLTEKITAMIPVELTGESPIVSQKQGILIQPVSEVEVEALPMDLPEKFILDISGLLKVEDSLTISDLKYDKKKIEVKADETLVVAKVEPLAAEEVAPAPAEGEEGAEGAEGVVPAEGEEGKAAESSVEDEKPAEGETPAETPAESSEPKTE